DRPMRPMESISTQYYVRIDVADEPGVLAEVARTFGGHDVSIAQVLQDETPHGMELVIVTHRALEASLQSTVLSLASVDGVHAVCSVIRVESEVGA
ncbi:MAG: homoserine dehydrogenase, partial [Myxococcota bacterium]